MNSPSSRIILLLDLDCFYAQAMCIRLGYNASETPLALFQWNSVLAVTYPARRCYKIQRGDSWDTVRSKSHGECLGIHVPILSTTANTDDATTEQTTPADETSTTLGNAEWSLEQEYLNYFQLTKEQQEQARQRELGVRKYSTEGKASIECFRIASARIFAVVKEFLQQSYNDCILERASIDEFFLDVTKSVDGIDLDESVLESTVSIDTQRPLITPEDIRMARGCAIASQIRAKVRETLGFTMTAGISVNKTIAKLAASYGKPNGQAVCYESDIPHLLQSTRISKCRNLGGKLGKSIAQLLSKGDEATVGDIVDELSVPKLLQNGFSESTARWVWNIGHGEDEEPVQAKDETAVLTKSITAFKSLNFGTADGMVLTELHPWIQLLAQEVVQRVERDTVRNARYPKTLVVQYTTSAYSSKSTRISFPPSKSSQKVETIVSLVPKTLHSKEGPAVKLRRIGLCATDFEVRGNNSIEKFFATNMDAASVSPKKPDKPDGTADLEMARALQAKYDREERTMRRMEDRQRRKKTAGSIDSFFQKRTKL